MSPASPLKVRPQVSAEVESTTVGVGPTTFAGIFYGIPNTLSTPTRGSPAQPFCTTFEDLVSLTEYAARTLVDTPEQLDGMREILVNTLTLLTGVVTEFSPTHEESTTLAWAPGAWLSCLLRCLEPKVRACQHSAPTAFDDISKGYVILDRRERPSVGCHPAPSGDIAAPPSCRRPSRDFSHDQFCESTKYYTRASS